MKRSLATLVLGCAVAACATGFHPDGLGGGYAETHLAPDVWRVTSRGNGYTSQTRALDFALLRSAQLALRAGYPYFVVLDSADATTTRDFRAASETTGTVTSTGGGSASIEMTTTPGASHRYTFPAKALLIHGIHSKSEGGSQYVYDADFLVKSLTAQYGIDN